MSLDKSESLSLINIGLDSLNKLEVPKEMLSFINGDLVEKIGEKMNSKGYYQLKNYIFKVDKGIIKKAYYNIAYFNKNSNKLP